MEPSEVNFETNKQVLQSGDDIDRDKLLVNQVHHSGMDSVSDNFDSKVSKDGNG